MAGLAAKPYLIDPLFTRDPAKIRDENVLMAMMAIAAVYEPYEVQRLTILAKLRPEPVREPLPPPKVYAPPSKGRYKRRG